MKSDKKRYGMLDNSLFMIRQAMETNPVVIWMMALQALLVVAGALLELYGVPAILGNLERKESLGTLLGTICFFSLGIMGVHALSAYLENNQMTARVPVRLTIIGKMWKKVGTCSYPVRESQDFTRLFAKATDATMGNGSPAEDIWNTFAGILQNLLGFAIYLYLLTHVDSLIVAVTLIASVAGFLVSSRINGWGYRHRQEEAEIKNRFFYFRDKARDRRLAKDVRIFGIGDWLEELLDKWLKAQEDFHLRRERAYLMADLTDIALTFLRNGIAYGWLLRLTLLGNLGAAEFLLYFTAAGGFTAWVSGIMGSFSDLHRQSMELCHIRELCDYEEVFLFQEGKQLAADSKKDYVIELRDVTFRYPGAERSVFSHLNLTLHPGEKLAVVGANGAGKTTLVKLLCGVYDPDEGAVLLDGVDIREFNRRDYYRLFGAVFQDFSLLAGEVAENVSSFDQEMDMNRVRECVEKTGLGGKIESLPKGYHTHLCKEVYEDAPEFSGGELQRLMMARLLYRDSPVMILDEPTAALDALAESDIYQKYRDLAKGKSSVFISHRLASTRFCDRIILLEGGRVAEEGTHEELLSMGGGYARLFEIQSRYYVKEPGGEGKTEKGGFDCGKGGREDAGQS